MCCSVAEKCWAASPTPLLRPAFPLLSACENLAVKLDCNQAEPWITSFSWLSL